MDNVRQLPQANCSPYVYEVDLLNRAHTTLPVDVQFDFQDGTKRRRTWTPIASAREKLRITVTSPLKDVQVDPDNKIALDPHKLEHFLNVQRKPSYLAENASFVSSILQAIFSWLGW